MEILVVFIDSLIRLGLLALNGAFVGTAAIGVYFLKRRWKRRELRRKLAEALGVELTEISELLNPTGTNRAAIDPATTYPRIPTAIYNGLVSSGNISNLDIVLQKQLYRFYRMEEENHLRM